MPISFFHGFEAAEPATRDFYPDQVQKLLAYIDGREAEDEQSGGEQNVALRLETHLVKGKGGTAAAIRYTDDPNAPAMTIREEDVLQNFPWTYSVLLDQLKARYVDFLANKAFKKHKKRIDQDRKCTIVRLMNPRNPEKTTTQKFYSPNVFVEFDKIYKRRRPAK